MPGTLQNPQGRRLVPTGGGRPVVLPGLGNITRNVFFQYVQNFTFVGVETQQATIQIQADAHFLCMMTAYDTSLAAAGGFGAGTASQFGGTLVALTDASGGRFLSTGPMPASTLFGTAQRPFVWPYTHMFRANGGITIQATGVIAAAQTVRYVFSGFKLPIGDAPEVGY